MPKCLVKVTISRRGMASGNSVKHDSLGLNTCQPTESDMAQTLPEA